MGIERQVIEAADQVGRETGISAEVLLAVCLVETRAAAYATIGERREPLIRFEGHYFDKQLSGTARLAARAEGLAHPRAGRIANPASQAGRWEMFDRAAAIDREAACASVSWGLCQVMGAHARTLGFHTAEALADTARQSIEGQFEIGARFLAIGNLAERLADGDLAGFSRRYNGPGYRRNRYDQKIAAALKRARTALASERGSSGQAGSIAIGARGSAVRRLQTALRNAGAVIAVDAIFGPRTHAALVAVQKAACLEATGITDSRTRSLLNL